MADTTVSTRALIYRDPTVSAAAEIQLRRNRQRSFDALVDQAQRTADAAAQVSTLEQGRADGFRAARDAVDQQADQSNGAEQQTEQAALAGSRPGTRTDDPADNPAEAQASGDATGTAHTQPTVTFSAQQIAQEQLGLGLHVPPLQPADEAYRRAGAEPPLPSEDSQPSLFALAV